MTRGFSTPVSSRGFTLLEVLIALAIVSGLLVTLLYTVNYHMGIVEKHEFTTVATLLGKQKLNDVKANASQSSGKFKDPYENYSFSAQVKDSTYPGIAEIFVAVTDGKEKVILREFVNKEALGK